MTRLLLLNPNTTEAVTAQLRARAAVAAPTGGILHARTATFGAAYIGDEPGAAIAAHAGLDAYARHVDEAGHPDAVLIGCFGDPGLEALRAVAEGTVHGLAEASMTLAAERGRFAIVTGGVHWPAMLRRLVGSLGLESALAGIVAVERTGGELAADPASALEHLRQACETARTRHRPDSLVLGGAALTAFAPALSAALALPVIDSVEAAVQVAWRSAVRRSGAGTDAPPVPARAPTAVAGTAWTGLSDALQSLLSRSPPGADGR
jgi:allantoin racemase